jgi:DNA-binding CsgD family transcriptional regulator
MTFGDWRRDPRWRKSTLYHEYYLEVGARHQVGMSLYQDAATRIVLNCNRWSRDFSEPDRAMLELLSPHLALAWRNAVELLALRRRKSAPEAAVLMRRHVLAIDSSARIVAPLVRGARELLRGYCGTDVGEGSRVPEPIGRWLNAQDRLFESADMALHRPLLPLVMTRAGATLVVRSVRASAEGGMIVLEETTSAARVPEPAPGGELTGREAEILRWVGEGKRNSEISVILGVSSRTVGKHLEHIFAKLGVETRTAAVRAAGRPKVSAHG